MDFGNYDGLKKPHAFVSADMILYRHTSSIYQNPSAISEVEILVSTRDIEPFKGYLSLTFGGYVDPTDDSPLHTAIRETEEECGITLDQHHTVYKFVGVFGPARIHKYFNGIPLLMSVEKRTNILGNPRPCVTLVFCHEYKGNMTPKESDEQKNIRWMKLRDIIKNYGEKIAFDHAGIIEKLMYSLYGGLTYARQSIHYDQP